MKRRLAETVVACLCLSGDVGDATELQKFGLRDWQRTFRWLDDSGLALYFLRHLQNVGATDMVPPQVLARLQGSLLANQLRWEHLTQHFARINESFQKAGLPFAVIKGLSLVPDYCPDAVLRAPSDLDYLVDRRSLPLAQKVLEAAGYYLNKRSDIELQFCTPSSRMPTISDSPYSLETEPVVELHVGFWNRANSVPLEEPTYRLERAVLHSWRGLHFPVLSERDAFLLQIVHVFQHTLEHWVKLCWLLEIGSFLSRRSRDADFWREVDDNLRTVPPLAEFAAIVIGLTKILFAAPVPEVAENWMHSLRPTARLWLGTYARAWAFDDHPFSQSSLFPTGKLALFLHQQYIPNPKTRKEMIRSRLFPWKTPQQVAFPVDHKPENMVAARQLQWQFVLDRAIFHSCSTLRYLWEVPRWRHLTG